jgi:hypothetical protein
MLIQARKEVFEPFGRKIWAPVYCTALSIITAGFSLLLLKLAQPPVYLFSVISSPPFRNLSNDTRVK